MKRFKKITSWIISKIGLQVFSLAVAVSAWIVVTSGQTTHHRKSLKIQYVQLPHGLAFQLAPLKEVSIDLEGSLYRLRAIKEDDLVYLVDLSSARPGVFRVELELESLRLPMDVKASRPSPRVFFVHLEEIAYRDIPVRPITTGTLKEGLMVFKVLAKPEVVSVTGPKSVISKLDFLEVKVPLEGRTETFLMNVEPNLAMPEVSVLTPIQIEVEVALIRVTREFKNVPVVLSSGPSNLKIEPSTGTIILEGAQAEMEQFAKNLQISLSADGLKRGRYRIRAQVDLPSGVKLISLEPKQFIVEVPK